METILYKPGNQNAPAYSYPETPFENIGFALSGGGFRAASYGLGVLSLMNQIKIDDEGKERTLLEKIRFVSSASGGTITLAVYVASLHQKVPFQVFYHHLKEQMAGEKLLERAIAILNDSQQWEESDKSHNIINAFSKAYHESLFAIIPKEGERTLDSIMPDEGPNSTHLQEFCFNATDFYTGISFRFQGGGKDWTGGRAGSFGNSNIGINWDNKENAVAALKKIRLSDVLAASSCFPMGFEPIVFPKDFTYAGGPTVQELKDAILLDTYSWDDQKTPEENARSNRAIKENEFAAKKTFGLMDGGICDNQGLFSLLLANDRKVKKEANSEEKDEPYNRFDLMMVSDVTSYFMSPYQVPEINTGKAWMQKTPKDYWQSFRNIWNKIPSSIQKGWWISILIAVLFLLPLFIEGISLASIVLALIGLVPLISIAVIRSKYKKFLTKNPIIKESLEQKSLSDLLHVFMPEESFIRRTAIKMVDYLQGAKTGEILQMINARVQSAATMIGDVFLKHIRRLIYDLLFSNPRYVYRRMDNPIYKLTYTNDKHRANPAFEPREDEDPELYESRKAAFVAEFKASCILSQEMQKTAELAYNTGTTLWFENEQEQAEENNREALIATGQFTTCYNLLSYTITLKHSRHFKTLEDKYQKRVLEVNNQLGDMMKEFVKDSYFLLR